MDVRVGFSASANSCSLPVRRFNSAAVSMRHFGVIVSGEPDVAEAEKQDQASIGLACVWFYPLIFSPATGFDTDWRMSPPLQRVSQQMWLH
jgi:hypothetical protein